MTWNETIGFARRHAKAARVKLQGEASAFVIAYLVGVNCATGAAFGWDKMKAVVKRKTSWSLARVSERTLHKLTAAGGTPAAVVCGRLFRHKVSKPAFRSKQRYIILCQGLGLGAAHWLSR